MDDVVTTGNTVIEICRVFRPKEHHIFRCDVYAAPCLMLERLFCYKWHSP
ncbi:MAG: hypothetical protein ACSLEN_03375 [Candidatus Malihini olakiniferum]